jgi:predicted MPP superfamily phosphohydrolase
MFSSWIGFAGLSVFLIALMTYGNINYRNIKRTELTIKTDKISEADNLKIVAVSDLHLGYGIGVKEFQKWVELINKENPDAVLLAGDVIDNSFRPIYKQNFAEIFGKIKNKYGIFLAPGNHEYISNIHKSIDFFDKVGVTMLKDSSVLVNDMFYIIGRDDHSRSNRKTLTELTSSLDNSKPIIVVDHQPFNLDEIVKNNIDLQISGHTHFGQVFPINLITKLMFELPYGYLQRENSHIYVTSGIGSWGGKFRIGTRSEYVVINVEKL